MPIKYLDDSNYTLGMIRDDPSWMLPPGALYDSLNLVYDQPGIARQRMGSTALVSGSQTAGVTSVGFCYFDDPTRIEELYGFNGKSNGVLTIINKSTGAFTNLQGFGAFDHIVGRAFRHFGFAVFPMVEASGGAGARRVMFGGGQTNTTTFVNGVAATMTAGNQQITLTGADVTTNVKVGGIVTAQDAGFVNSYMGRVVSIDTTKLFTVSPTPTLTTTIPIAQLGINFLAGNRGGACGASFQNRLLFGNTNDLTSVSSTAVTDRRVYYSVLPTETSKGATGPTTLGANFLAPNQWPQLNYFEVPGSDPIVAMEPISGNQLLILTSTHPVVFSGNLTTQLATTSPTITFDLSDINVNAGCLSDLSVQRTPKGVVWAGIGDIYAWNGREPVSLTEKKLNTFWRSKVRGSSFAVHGSAYVRDHYIISYTSGGVTEALAIHLSHGTWTRMQGVGTDNFFGVARPTDPSQVFAVRWWDQTGAAPSMTNGQTLRLESMMAPYVTGATTTDADGTAVTLSATTRTITGDPELQKLFQRATVRHQQSSTTAAVAVTAQSKIDAADISAASVRAIGSLSNTSVLTVTNATNANPIAVTTSANHGLQSDDFVDIDGVTGNTNANGRWRIVVTGATTFTLVGGIGNAAFGGSPTCKKVTETDFLISTLNSGQGVSYKFDGAPNNFELHGTRTAVLQKEPVMSA